MKFINNCIYCNYFLSCYIPNNFMVKDCMCGKTYIIYNTLTIEFDFIDCLIFYKLDLLDNKSFFLKHNKTIFADKSVFVDIERYDIDLKILNQGLDVKQIKDKIIKIINLS